MDLKSAVSSVLGRSHAQENGATPDALAIIKADHEEVSHLFSVALDENTKGAAKRSAIAQICSALTLHAKMEEKIFYPALRRAGREQEKDSVLEANEEHAIVKELIRKIGRTELRDETLKAKLTVLKESVEHHVKEEESEMFSEARRVLGAKLGPLGAEMLRFKERNDPTAPKRGARKPAAKKAPARAAAAKKAPKRKATR